MGHLVGKANTILSLEYDGLDHLDLMQDNIGHDSIEYCDGRLREWRPHGGQPRVISFILDDMFVGILVTT